MTTGNTDNTDNTVTRFELLAAARAKKFVRWSRSGRVERLNLTASGHVFATSPVRRHGTFIPVRDRYYLRVLRRSDLVLVGEILK